MDTENRMPQEGADEQPMNEMNKILKFFVMGDPHIQYSSNSGNTHTSKKLKQDMWEIPGFKDYPV